MTLQYKAYAHQDVTQEIMEFLLREKMYESTYKNSLMKAMYEESIQPGAVLPELTLVIAYKEDRPVGVALVKWQAPERFQLELLTSTTRYNAKVEKQFDKHFVLQGWFQIYVAPEHREQGIAKAMARRLEVECIRDPSFDLKPHELPLLIACGDAREVLQRSMRYHYALRSALPYTNFAIDIHQNTRQYYEAVFEGRGSFLQEETRDYVITLPKVKPKSALNRK